MRRVFLTSLLAIGLLMMAGCSGDDSGNGDGDGASGGDTGSDGSDGASGGDDDDASSSGSGDDDDASGGSAGSGASDDDSGNAAPSDGSQGSPGLPPSFVPQFPGAGTDADTEPLEGGMLCDAVAGDSTTEVIIPPTTTRCFFGPEDKMNAAATIEQALECAEGSDTVHLRLTFDPGFNDNTFGEGSIGWPEKRGHRFDDLVKSDHAELKLVDGNGDVAMQFKLDYISQDDSAESGYATLGVAGGDGNVTVGDPAHVIDFSTSLHKNLNERGYSEYTTDSPATDDNYTANPDTPEWDYRMVFEVWIDLEAFGDAGFAGAFIDYVHASPAKSSSDTIEVTPGECVPPCEVDECPTDHPCYDGDPDTVCDYSDPCTDFDEGTACNPDDDACWDGDPDTFCSEGDVPPSDSEDPPGTGEAPPFCELYPSDPSCFVE